MVWRSATRSCFFSYLLLLLLFLLFLTLLMVTSDPRMAWEEVEEEEVILMVGQCTRCLPRMPRLVTDLVNGLAYFLLFLVQFLLLAFFSWPSPKAGP